MSSLFPDDIPVRPATTSGPRYVIVQGVIAPETFPPSTVGPGTQGAPLNTSLLESVLAQLRAGLERLIATLSPVRPGVPSTAWAPPIYLP